MIRPELRNFYDTDENINESLITLNAFTDKFSNNTYTLQRRIDNYCHGYKQSVRDNQSVTSEDKENILKSVDDAFTSFKHSLDSISKEIRQYSVEMKQRAPAISSLLHNFEYLQKERTHIKNKNIMLQSSEIYETELININAQISETLQEYTAEVKWYNDRIDILQQTITYLNQTDNSSPSLISNQFVLSWDGVLSNFENVIEFIKGDSELLNNIKSSLKVFVSSIQNVKLIKFTELKDIERQLNENIILIENLRKQVSDLSTKNLDLTKTIETHKEQANTIQVLNFAIDKYKEEAGELLGQITELQAKNKELQQNNNEYVKQYNDYKEKMEQEQLEFKTKIHELEETNKTIANSNLEQRKELITLKKEKEKLINEIDQLKKLHDDDNEANTELRERNNEQTKMIHHLHRQLDMLKQESGENLAKREQELLNQVKELENALSIAASKSHQEQEEIINLKDDEIKKVRENLARTNLQISELENKLKASDEQILVLNTEKQNWNQSEIELKQKYEAERSKNESLKAQIEELIQAGPSTEVLSRQASDDNQSRAHLKRKVQSDKDLAKRTKQDSSTSWQQQMNDLDFTDTRITVTINNIKEKTWKPVRRQIKESNNNLNRLHDKLAAVHKRFETTQKLRNRNEKRIPPGEINSIINEIRENLKTEEQHNHLMDVLHQVGNNYEKDIELQNSSQLIFINLINSIKADYDEKVNSYNQKLNQLTSQTTSDSKKIMEKIYHQLEVNEDKTNIKLKNLQKRIILFIEKFNERNEIRKELLFTVQCYIVNNIYSKVNNELLISIDKLIY